MAKRGKRNGGREFYALLKVKGEDEKYTAIKISGRRSRRYAKSKVEIFAGEKYEALLVLAKGAVYFPSGGVELYHKLSEMIRRNQIEVI